MKNEKSPRSFDESKFDDPLLKIEREGPIEQEPEPDLSKLDDSKKFKTELFVDKDALKHILGPQAE